MNLRNFNKFLPRCAAPIRTDVKYIMHENAAPIRTDVEGVTNLYNNQGTYTVSLNDQMELFYEKCRDDELTQHEVTYYFHAELLPLKLEEKFRDKKNKFIFKESKEKEFDVYAGVRATLVFHLEPAVQRTSQFYNLANTLSGMIYAQFWPGCCPTDNIRHMYIPETTKEIKVIGAENFKRQLEHHAPHRIYIPTYDYVFDSAVADTLLDNRLGQNRLSNKVLGPKEYPEFEYSDTLLDNRLDNSEIRLNSNENIATFLRPHQRSTGTKKPGTFPGTFPREPRGNREPKFFKIGNRAGTRNKFFKKSGKGGNREHNF